MAKSTGCALALVVAIAVLAPHITRAARPEHKEAAAAILKADADFARAVADGDVPRFLSFIAEVTTFNGGSSKELHGRDAVKAGWARFFEPGGPRLTWRPTASRVIGAGDIGYTTGESVFRARNKAGAMTESKGEYLTVWAKQPDGRWQVVFDTGSTLP